MDYDGEEVDLDELIAESEEFETARGEREHEQPAESEHTWGGSHEGTRTQRNPAAANDSRYAGSNDDDDDDEWMANAAQHDAEQRGEEVSPVAEAPPMFVEFFSKLPPLGAESLSITLPGDVRRFVAPKSNKLRPVARIEHAPVLTESFDDLRLRIAKKKNSRIGVDHEETMAYEDDEAGTASGSGPGKKLHRAPLVDRHMPTKFCELLSHERANREALRWLKAWDEFIFQEAPATSRPEQRILILAGPPGSGKTTLAHVLARHAGYRVVEINASDERTAETLRRRIGDATEMRSAFGKQRPNLVVLDEADGLDQAAVAAVLQLATQSSGSKKPVLNRPLICTCNDVYAPALKLLRQSACTLVLQIRLPTEARLVARLKEVCRLEHIPERPGALNLLAKRMRGDIRACLNALDLWHGAVLDVEAVERLPASAKDASADLFDTWRQVVKGEASSLLVERLGRHFGEFDFVVEGVHENYLGAGYRDATLTRTAKAAEWLAFADELQGQTGQDMDFAFQSYVPYCVAGLSRAIGSNPKASVTFPSLAREARREQELSEAAVHEFIEGVPRLSSLRSSLSLALEGADALVAVCSPRVRPVPIGLMNAVEKKEMQRAAQVMAGLGLTYVADGAAASQGALVLDPRVDKLCSFAKLPNALLLHAEGRSELAHEISLLRMRRHHALDDPLARAEASKEKKRAKIAAGTTATEHRIPVIAPSVRKDFFGRTLPEPEMSEEKRNEAKGVLFRFKEGFSDAVRRQVKMREFAS